MKAIKALGVCIVGIAELVIWHHFLVSSRSPVMTSEYDYRAHDRFSGTLFRSFRRTRRKGNRQPESGMWLAANTNVLTCTGV
jgi:hypothetical protein